MIPANPPILRARTYTELLDELYQRLRVYCPEWTTLEYEGDPGTTLVQLYAWLTEALAARVERLPGRIYADFMEFLGEEPAPAIPASTLLTFAARRLTGMPGDIRVPAGLEVASRRTESGPSVRMSLLRALRLRCPRGDVRVIAFSAPSTPLAPGLEGRRLQVRDDRLSGDRARQGPLVPPTAAGVTRFGPLDTGRWPRWHHDPQCTFDGVGNRFLFVVESPEWLPVRSFSWRGGIARARLPEPALRLHGVVPSTVRDPRARLELGRRFADLLVEWFAPVELEMGRDTVRCWLRLGEVIGSGKPEDASAGGSVRLLGLHDLFDEGPAPIHGVRSPEAPTRALPNAAPPMADPRALRLAARGRVVGDVPCLVGRIRFRRALESFLETWRYRFDARLSRLHAELPAEADAERALPELGESQVSLPLEVGGDDAVTGRDRVMGHEQLSGEVLSALPPSASVGWSLRRPGNTSGHLAMSWVDEAPVERWLDRSRLVARHGVETVLEPPIHEDGVPVLDRVDSRLRIHSPTFDWLRRTRAAGRALWFEQLVLAIEWKSPALDRRSRERQTRQRWTLTRRVGDSGPDQRPVSKNVVLHADPHAFYIEELELREAGDASGIGRGDQVRRPSTWLTIFDGMDWPDAGPVYFELRLADIDRMPGDGLVHVRGVHSVRLVPLVHDRPVERGSVLLYSAVGHGGSAVGRSRAHLVRLRAQAPALDEWSVFDPGPGRPGDPGEPDRGFACPPAGRVIEQWSAPAGTGHETSTLLLRFGFEADAFETHPTRGAASAGRAHRPMGHPLTLFMRLSAPDGAPRPRLVEDELGAVAHRFDVGLGSDPGDAWSEVLHSIEEMPSDLAEQGAWYRISLRAPEGADALKDAVADVLWVRWTVPGEVPPFVEEVRFNTELAIAVDRHVQRLDRPTGAAGEGIVTRHTPILLRRMLDARGMRCDAGWVDVEVERPGDLPVRAVPWPEAPVAMGPIRECQVRPRTGEIVFATAPEGWGEGGAEDPLHIAYRVPRTRVEGLGAHVFTEIGASINRHVVSTNFSAPTPGQAAEATAEMQGRLARNLRQRAITLNDHLLIARHVFRERWRRGRFRVKLERVGTLGTASLDDGIGARPQPWTEVELSVLASLSAVDPEEPVPVGRVEQETQRVARFVQDQLTARGVMGIKPTVHPCTFWRHDVTLKLVSHKSVAEIAAGVIRAIRAHFAPFGAPGDARIGAADLPPIEREELRFVVRQLDDVLALYEDGIRIVARTDEPPDRFAVPYINDVWIHIVSPEVGR